LSGDEDVGSDYADENDDYNHIEDVYEGDEFDDSDDDDDDEGNEAEADADARGNVLSDISSNFLSWPCASTERHSFNSCLVNGLLRVPSYLLFSSKIFFFLSRGKQSLASNTVFLHVSVLRQFHSFTQITDILGDWPTVAELSSPVWVGL